MLKRLVYLLLIWFIYIKLYYLSSFKLYMYMYTLRTAEIDVDTHEWVTEARIVKERVGLKDKNKLINCQWRRNGWQYNHYKRSSDTEMKCCPMSTDENIKRNATPKPIPPPQKKSPSYMYSSIHGTHDLKQKWKLSNKRRLIRMPLYNICIMVIN